MPRAIRRLCTEMIHQTHRFHGHNSLRFVYTHGQTVRSQHLVLKYVRNPRRKTYRVAVVVSRKVSKSAVVRNRIRRRIYEIIRIQSPHITQAYDLVFTVFSDQLATTPYPDVAASVTMQLQKGAIRDDFGASSSETML